MLRRAVQPRVLVGVASVTRRYCGEAQATVRNIGIVAHIDAGKTTTTERMLYESSAKRRLGGVDLGTTTTDYMDQERERGITIQSAMTKLGWRDSSIYIIDTPGHVDFTMEVERTLRILDGAVAVFDSVKGVEPQSRTVIMQTEKFGIPFLTYINKMDRQNADFEAALDSIERLLNIAVVPIQAPWPLALDQQAPRAFEGYVDLVTLNVFRWTGDEVKMEKLQEQELKDVTKLRSKMLDSLSGVSDEIAEAYLQAMDAGDEAGTTIPGALIRSELKKASKARQCTAALCGSASKGVGIHALMDAIIDYLPSPTERPPLVAADPVDKVVSTDYAKKDPLAALVFKVQVQGKDLKSVSRATLVRVYSGVLKTGSKIYNSTRGVFQTVKSIGIVDGADMSQTVPSLGPGRVGCVWGLDMSYTGDTLCEDKKSCFTLEGVEAPIPVVSACLEPFSEKDEKTLESALEVIKLEDPSVQTSINDYGQTVLSGMGGLHIEITKTKIERGWHLDLATGPVRVSHREWISEPCKAQHLFRTKPDDASSAACELLLNLTPLKHDKHGISDLTQEVTMSLEDMIEEEATKQKLRLKWLPTIKRGIEQGLGAGPTMREMVCGVKVDVASIKLHTKANEDTVGNAADYTTKLLLASGARHGALLEPVMRVNLVIYSRDVLEPLVSDLAGVRRAEVVSQSRGPTSYVTALAPVSQLSTYATDVRSISGGEAHFTSTFAGYRVVADPSVIHQLKSA